MTTPIPHLQPCILGLSIIDVKASGWIAPIAFMDNWWGTIKTKLPHCRLCGGPAIEDQESALLDVLLQRILDLVQATRGTILCISCPRKEPVGEPLCLVWVIEHCIVPLPTKTPNQSQRPLFFKLAAGLFASAAFIAFMHFIPFIDFIGLSFKR